jgi:DIS3-like exonuclease 2
MNESKSGVLRTTTTTTTTTTTAATTTATATADIDIDDLTQKSFLSLDILRRANQLSLTDNWNKNNEQRHHNQQNNDNERIGNIGRIGRKSVENSNKVITKTTARTNDAQSLISSTSTSNFNTNKVARKLKMLFKGSLKVNAHENSVAYVQLAFLPIDVKFLISSSSTTEGNDVLVVDGDVVEFVLEEPIEWLLDELKEKNSRSNNRNNNQRSRSGTPRSAASTSSYSNNSNRNNNNDDNENSGNNDDNGSISKALLEKLTIEERTDESIKRFCELYEGNDFDSGGDVFDAAAAADDDDDDASVVIVQKKLEDACRFFTTMKERKNKSAASIIGDNLLRPIGTIIRILEPSPKRNRMVGFIVNDDTEYNSTNNKKNNEKNLSFSNNKKQQQSKKSFRLQPTDSRMPVCAIDIAQSEVKNLENVPENHLVFASMLGDYSTSLERTCSIERIIGASDSIETHTAKIIFERMIKDEPFSEEVLACLPKEWNDDAGIDLILSEDNRENEPPRKDFRNDIGTCTIDPETARDLDDSLFATRVDEDRIRVCVHIADVSHFVKPKTALDEEAQERATSNYLCDRVVPMLPRLLSEIACSLNPGVDRYAMSCEWIIRESDGAILKEWFGRSVMRSRAKLSYEDAQRMINQFDESKSDEAVANAEKEKIKGAGKIESDGDDDKDNNNKNLLAVVKSVRLLRSIAKVLRENRVEDGSVRLDQAKIGFEIDVETKLPKKVFKYERRESNSVIEELMLLANRRVATRIADYFPDVALLRFHPPPSEKKIDELRAFAESHGFTNFDCSSSSGLHKSLERIRRSSLFTDSKNTNDAIYEIVNVLAAKSMQLAEYFCTGAPKKKNKEESWRHYALAFDRYTHFTSPIRRYPDIIVHRLLRASLVMEQKLENENGKKPKIVEYLLPESTSACVDIAIQCNAKKSLAKMAQDDHSFVYFCYHLSRNPTVTTAIARIVGRKHIACFVPEFGIEVKVEIGNKRHLRTTQVNGTPTPQMCSIEFESSDASAEAVEKLSLAREPVDGAERKSLLKKARGVSGAFLNLAKLEEESVNKYFSSLSENNINSSYDYSSARIVLPMHIKPADEILVVLTGKFGEKVPEIVANIVLRNPLI